MRERHSVGPLWLFLAFGSSLAPAFGGDSAAEATLRQKGLAKAGHSFVIEAEKPVLAKIKEVKAAFLGYAMLADKQAASERYEAESARLEEHRVELKTHYDDLNQRIIEQATSQVGGGSPRQQGPGGGPPGGSGPTSPLVMEREQVKAALSEVTIGQKALKAEAPQVRDKAALELEVKKKGEVFKTSLAELRPMVDQVVAKYAELGLDGSVKKALEDLRKATKAKANLGPSDAFLAATKELNQAERRFLGKRTPTTVSKKKSRSKK